MNPERNAILIFANSPEQEAVQKPFYKSVELFRELNSRTVQMAEKIGIPFFLFTEKEQIGNSFGERYVNAIETIFKKGFDNVITIGSDTPQLNENHLLDTIEKLKTTPVVIGPSVDGGFYLMGLNKSLFKRDAFINLPWQTFQLRTCLIKNALPANIEVAFLEAFIDIDHASDVYLLLQKPLPKKLLQILRAVIHNKGAFFSKNIQKKYSHYPPAFFNKGSPLFISRISS